MRPICATALAATVVLLASPIGARAQTSQPAPASVPRVINLTGVFQPVDGQPPRAVETVTLAIYAEPTGGAPLWQETQSVAVDTKGRYALLLGATSADGLPAAVLAAGAQWLGTKFDRPGEVEGPRLQLTSVPYTLRAADADTLGGRPASAYLLAPTTPHGKSRTATTAGQATATEMDPSAPAPQAVNPGTVNFLSKYVTAADVGNSAVFENAGRVGIGTTAPLDSMHVNFTNTNGAVTGYAVQNLGNTTTSYSGMLFYDQNGALGQFQGFNNATHEYRINNIAQAAGQFNGSINFMIGSVPRFLVTSGNIGIGTTTPFGELEVSNGLNPGHAAAIFTLSSFGLNGFGSSINARKARGTVGAPSAVLNGDTLTSWTGQGYGATGFGNSSSGISIMAAENWTDTAQGSLMNFTTTPTGTTQPVVRMTLSPGGNVGIGTLGPGAGNLEVSNATNTANFGNIFASSFTGTNTGGSMLLGRKARGTSAAPTAAQAGDILVGFLGSGYGTTAFGGRVGGMFVQAAENFTDTAQGTRLNFSTTATGTNILGTKMTIDPFGNVGIGTTNPIEALEIVRNAETNFVGTSYNNGDGSAIFFQRARGTSQTPSAVQAGDALGYFGATGYAATTWGNGAGAIAVVAAENWTDTANGNAIGFATTPAGTTDFVVQAAILSNGNVGLGTPGDAHGIPTATDRLQAFGDIRVGTSGTNGCLKNFAGTGIAGTCASDRRFKKNITPFGPALDRITALQPVHYYWRATEFPDRHFGDAQAYGLVAQDVEQVLPELVVTNEDGYKAVDYSKLPLLTIQAVKELNTEVRGLKTENDELKQRLADLERMFAELLATSSRR